jgi:hypothetical protein
MPMDRCKCWGTTTVTITIEHCPSATTEIAKEIDKIILFAMKETSLNRFGKATSKPSQFVPATVDGEK